MIRIAGIGVSVYCIIAEPVDLLFTLDGEFAGSYTHAPDEPTTYEYGVAVYVNNALSPGQHTIEIQNGRPDGAQSLALLDSIVYMYVFSGPCLRSLTMRLTLFFNIAETLRPIRSPPATASASSPQLPSQQRAPRPHRPDLPPEPLHSRSSRPHTSVSTLQLSPRPWPLSGYSS